MSIDLKLGGAAFAAYIAYYAGSNAIAIARADGDNLHWPTFGVPKITGNPIDTYLEPMAAFVRNAYKVGGEELYRFAQGAGIHDAAAHAFEEIEPEYRLAYSLFASTLSTIDGLVAKEVAKAEAAVQASRPAPIAAALSLPVEETTLETLDDPLAKVSLTPAASSVPAAAAPAADAPEAAVAAALGDPVEVPAPAAGVEVDTYWINPILGEIAIGHGGTAPSDTGWVQVDQATYDAFSFMLHPKAAAPEAPAPEIEAPAEGAPTTEESTAEDASTDDQGAADGAAADAGTTTKQARRRPVNG